MNVGFTGTHTGITLGQNVTLTRLLAERNGDWFLHGCCVGADEQAARIADSLGYRLLGYPGRPPGDSKRAAILNHRQREIPPTRTPELDRNHDIVDDCDLLIACPRGYHEQRRSGTWATIRYARRSGRPFRIIWPNGETSERWPDPLR